MQTPLYYSPLDDFQRPTGEVDVICIRIAFELPSGSKLAACGCKITIKLRDCLVGSFF